MKYLFVGAHQDDVEFSCGGTILRLVDKGHDVYIAVMSNGASSTNATGIERMIEQEKAFEFSRAEKLFLFDLADGAINVDAKIISDIANVIDQINPDVVFTHYPSDSHQDHRSVAEIVKSATRRKCALIYFDSYSSVNFRANLFVDVTQYIDEKKKMLNLFESQISKYNSRGIDFVEKSVLISKLNGYECKTSYAEGFAVDSLTI